MEKAKATEKPKNAYDYYEKGEPAKKSEYFKEPCNSCKHRYSQEGDSDYICDICEYWYY
jgi:hypothetical protein